MSIELNDQPLTGELLGQTGMEWADSSLTDVIKKSEQYEATNTSKK